MAANKRKQKRRLKREIKRRQMDSLKQSWRQIFVRAGVLK
jgi:hypothetical protein